MQSKNYKTISKLVEIPNIGKVIAAKLTLIGITKPKDLIGKDPLKLYKQLCDFSGEKIDLCVLDVFMSAVHFMESGETLSWWKFTDSRKNMMLR